MRTLPGGPANRLRRCRVALRRDKPALAGRSASADRPGGQEAGHHVRLVTFVRLVAFAAVVSAAGAIHAQTVPSPERALARDILRELMEIPTTEEMGMTPRAARAMADRLLAAGFPATDVHVLTLTPRVGNLVARLRGADARTRPILLMAHIDVVPARRDDWSLDPFTLTERDGWFYGRGTTDNKAGAAMLVANFIRLRREGWQPRRDLIIALTGDEETTQASIQWLLKEHRHLVDAEFALNTDSGRIILRGGKPSLFTVQASEKVYADYQLDVRDVGGHSSLARPDNPIYTLAAALQRIAAHQFPLNVTEVARLFFERSARVESGRMAADLRAVAATPPDPQAAARLSKQPFYNARLRTTCVATRVEAGHANNALPQTARAVINCRILPGEPTGPVEAALRRLAGDRVTLTVLSAPQASPSSPLSAAMLARFERLAAVQWPGVPVTPVMEAGATDGMYTRLAGISTYAPSALPEDPDDVRAHGKDERLGVEAFYDATQFWYQTMKAFGAQ
ncbi:MAG: M20/M25/M40 family metallo-hydrolase [Acidobacteria bacterium]|nr:M20/M25/M40 family metallo-hydrolase [Acidobacteriota bacterium]